MKNAVTTSACAIIGAKADTRRSTECADAAVDALVCRHERALVVRLLAVVERWRAADGSGRIEPGWAHIAAWPPGALERAVRSPLLHGWVGTAERLLACGAVDRYPEAHAARHAIDLGRVALDLAEIARTPVEGVLDALCRDRLSLALGRATLRFGGAAPRRIRWSLDEEFLRITDDRGRFADLDLAQGATREASPPWTVAWLPAASGIVIDLEPWSWADTVRASILDLLPAVADRARALLRTIVQHDPDEPWIAGVARLPAHGHFDVAQLSMCIERDRAERLLDLHVFSDGPTFGTAFAAAHDVRARVVEVVARLCAARARDDEPARDDVEAWSALAKRLRAAGLEELAETLLPSRIGETVPPRTPGKPTVHAFSSTHQGADDPIDWSALDALCGLERSQLEQLARPGAHAFSDEAEGWQAAAARYVTAQFAACVDALRTCLASDPDVDRYWILLAFALRHLGERVWFDRLVFDGQRDPSLLRTLTVAS